MIKNKASFSRQNSSFFNDSEETWILFGEKSVSCSLERLLVGIDISPSEFIGEGNKLFNKYNIHLPSKEFPEKCKISNAFHKRLRGKDTYAVPWAEFILCVTCCILLENKFSINTSKILNKELIKPNSRTGILHACSMAVIALHYRERGYEIEIPTENKEGLNHDLTINKIKCEIKTVDFPDWTKELVNNDGQFDQDFLLTGKGKERMISENICFDIGRFISNKPGHKGIRQGEMIFADLSEKSLNHPVVRNSKIENMPIPKRYRIVFFSKNNLDLKGFFVDFQSGLWKLIKNNKRKTRISICPAPLK